MSRISDNEVLDGKLLNGFDYEKQAWVVDGIYQDCGHLRSMGEDCCHAHQIAGQKVS